MANEVDILDAVVVGAGWAGLGVSHALKQRGLSHRVLERARIAETWRTQRWNSFRMNTPNVQTVMPGDTYKGSDPDGVMTCDEFIALLEEFAERNNLPVERDSPVTHLSVGQEGGTYVVSTPHGPLRARNVVIASGNLNIAQRPNWSASLPRDLHQIDISDYRSATDLRKGAVLVVGSGNSGGQVADDLADAGRAVYLATSRTGRLPRSYRGKHIMVWLVDSGFLDVRREQVIQMAGRIPARGLLGPQRTISLQSLGAKCVVLLGRMTGVDDQRHLTFANDLEENVRFADEASAKVKQYIDEFIARVGTAAPAAEPDRGETIAASLPTPPIRSLDPVSADIGTVIWCTGFRGDFSWVRLPGILDAQGQPVHEDGVTWLPGVYFAGLDFLSTRKSGIVVAIAEEADRLVEHIVARR